ncbi:MAG: hypothetical protein JSS09_06120 [Verrucomicrobia bacterium]|nr:hypothetical protein [Verrucomicrobiota bacterium]
MTVSAVGSIDNNLNSSIGSCSQTGQFFGRSIQKIDPKIISFIQELPQGGFIDLEGFLGMQPGVKLWNEDVSFSIDKLNMMHLMAVTERLMATLTIGRAFCFFGACYHTVVGFAKLCIVATEYNGEKSEKITSLFKSGVNHLILAVYNGIVTMPLVNFLFAKSYALFPQWVEEKHRIFAGTQIPIDLEKRQIIHAKRQELEALGCEQLSKAIGACIDAAEPYDSFTGNPIEISLEKRESSLLSKKAKEITEEFFKDQT